MLRMLGIWFFLWICTNILSISGLVNLGHSNMVLNPDFSGGLSYWSGRGCQVLVSQSLAGGEVSPASGKVFATATGRNSSQSAIQQELTGRVKRKTAYEVDGLVRIFGGVPAATVQANLWVLFADSREQIIAISRVNATDSDWVKIQGKFLINGVPSRVVILLEGPPPGTDILLNSLAVKPASKTPPAPPPLPISDYGVNIISNSNLDNGVNGWFPLGGCNLSVESGAPVQAPPLASESLGNRHEPLSGLYIVVSNRRETWMSPAQKVTERIRRYATYQVSGWVRIGSGATRPQPINVVISADGQWINGGKIEIGGSDNDDDDQKWHEVSGSFRIEKEFDDVTVYVQGPDPGVDLMVAGLQIFAVDRKAWFKSLKKRTNKVRKRDVTLRFAGPMMSSLGNGTRIRIKQVKNAFPIGSCLNRRSIENEDFVAFFLKHFSWAVFENELKWYSTEAKKGELNYKDADDMLGFCRSHGIQVRGHCIFWEDPNAVQPWVRELNGSDLMAAVQSRLSGVVSRYKGRFRHYDVDNEMLHSSFYKDRLGDGIRAEMYKNTSKLDSSPTLFVNEYHVEDGEDNVSSPEKYIKLILDLKQQGANVGGIGIQGHMDAPVGPIMRSALDKLGALGLPIWFTEVDVSSDNDNVRADDLEVVFREAFAHPAVDGIVLWGFWELLMNRPNAFLVNADGSLNEAGRRFVALEKEWLAHADGYIGKDGRFSFRGYQGSYLMHIFTPKGIISKKFNVGKGDDPLLLSVKI